jgi:hypothetical protein
LWGVRGCQGPFHLGGSSGRSLELLEQLLEVATHALLLYPLLVRQFVAPAISCSVRISIHHGSADLIVASRKNPPQLGHGGV